MPKIGRVPIKVNVKTNNPSVGNLVVGEIAAAFVKVMFVMLAIGMLYSNHAIPFTLSFWESWLLFIGVRAFFRDGQSAK
jgi:hypothetical protein